jgi:hypothetical protein
MENLLLEKTAELMELMEQYEKSIGSVRNPIYSAHYKLNEFANYLKCRLDNETIKGDELSFTISENKSIPMYLHNKKYVAIEKESDYDNHYVKCFDCAMYNHTFKECLRSRGFKIPNCDAEYRKDGKSVIYIKDKS